MKLASVVALAALKASFKELGISLASKPLSIAMAIKLGFFLKDFYRDDSFATTDNAILTFFKTLTENPAVAELAVKAFTKTLTDESSTADVDVIEFFKNLADGTATADVLAFNYSSVLADTVIATDDVDGSASILDDQEMQYFKNTTNLALASDSFSRTVAFTRSFTEPPSVTDLAALTYGTTFLETPSFTDAGLLRSQGYCDFSFFAEDFVGASRTF